MDLRQLHEELDAELPHLTWDQLKELAEFAKVTVDKVRKKHVIVHLINEEIDVVIEKEGKDAARQYIGDVLEVIKRMKKENALEAEKSLSEDKDELAKLKKQYADLQLMFQCSTKSLESEITRLSDQVKKKESRSASAILRDAEPQPSRVPEVTIRRDFKIWGQIGHFKEDGPTDLYHKLVNITQDYRESPQNILFRAIELKERLLIASRVAGREEMYSVELIQKKFLRSVSTGLISDHIKFQLKFDLENQSITDEELIERMNDAAGIETERQQKQKKNACAKVTKVNELQADVQALQRLDRQVEATDNGHKLWDGAAARGKEQKSQSSFSRQEAELFEQLKEEIAEIKKSIHESQPSLLWLSIL
ncbi:uncharacterized protein LOC113030617 isoform X1 [Tachysurus ichikawai]